MHIEFKETEDGKYLEATMHKKGKAPFVIYIERDLCVYVQGEDSGKEPGIVVEL